MAEPEKKHKAMEAVKKYFQYPSEHFEGGNTRHKTVESWLDETRDNILDELRAESEAPANTDTSTAAIYEPDDDPKSDSDESFTSGITVQVVTSSWVRESQNYVFPETGVLWSKLEKFAKYGKLDDRPPLPEQHRNFYDLCAFLTRENLRQSIRRARLMDHNRQTELDTFNALYQDYWLTVCAFMGQDEDALRRTELRARAIIDKLLEKVAKQFDWTSEPPEA
ncbi:hypothetical protein BJ508DRAFT_365936 [Ascobolus immersus RN42]|uniref:Uncharacterized protein n=1 Tax=Ascobolus immersus RN42 TaxID=1160509 RepID=A0A3N4HT59_ASCIM|nr:hypothetical protein BJ508DRAFT_365936 [Ascobolus immersus RN42]